MYAITNTGYRSIARAEDVLEGEQAVEDLPAALVAAVAEAEARGRRNDLLRASDWTQMADAPLTSSGRTAWAAYRQQLRDLPGDADWPACAWPEPPALEGAAGVSAGD